MAPGHSTNTFLLPGGLEVCNHRRRDKDSGCHFRNVFLPNTNIAVKRGIEPVLLAPKVMGVQQLLDTGDGTGGIAVATAALGNTVSNGLLLIEGDAETARCCC